MKINSISSSSIFSNAISSNSISRRVVVILWVLFVGGWSLFSHGYANELAQFNKVYDEVLQEVLVKQTFNSQYGTFHHNAVKYKYLAGNPQLKALIKKEAARLKTIATPPQKLTHLAFWINAYNFFTLKAVADNYPVTSMKKIGWKEKNIFIGTLTASLDDIEHKIIRPLGDARTHFALNCASVSCPTLLDRPFVQDTLDATLVKLSKEALRSPIHIRPAVKGLFGGEKLGLSKIFKWYKEDFYLNGETLATFIKKYKPASLTAHPNKGITYVDYNWDLNTSENINAFIKTLNQEGAKITRATP
ncbi:hypothetical protein COTS27_00654 [Spirochaetota bacterium]|nr:hypothetical protein COTS27_00654 [Spirochaetota bacterium]